MKRRSFIQWLFGAPAAAAVTKLEPAAAAIEPPEWEPTIFDNGNFGVLSIRVIGKAGHAKATVYHEYCDYVDQCNRVRELEFETGMYFWIPGNRPTKEPPTLVVPCFERDIVRFEFDDIIIYEGKPEWDPELWDGAGQFKPWEFHGFIEIGAFDG